MTRGEYELAKETAERVQQELCQPNLSDDARVRLQQVEAALARHIGSVWFPFEWRHRFWLLLWTITGISGVALQGHRLLLLGWLSAAMCSPRIVSRLSGALSRNGEGS